MGRALAYDFCRQPLVQAVLVCDISEANLAEAEKLVKSPRAKFQTLDIQNDQALRKALEGVTLAVGAVSYQFNARLTKACIENGVHFLDLGGNDAIVDQQFELAAQARERDVAVFPDCGLAPGLAGILAMHVYRQFDSCESLHLRVGGLPRHPRPPLNYMIVFSVHGLINEYKEPVRILEGGQPKTIPGMSGLEKLTFPQPFGELEAFYTSGGVSTLVKTLEGKVDFLDYKTIRYKGHQEKIEFLMNMGFFDEEKTRLGISAREMSEEVLVKKLSLPDEDVILFRIWGEGQKGGKKFRHSFECIDYFDQDNQLTSMMRTTAFPAAIIAGMILSGGIASRGVLRQEEHVPIPELLTELKKRQINITESHTDLIF